MGEFAIIGFKNSGNAVVVPYLWGIETETLLMVTKISKKVVPYLWGIETISSVLKKSFLGVVPYLWGIETYSIW